MKFIVLNGSPKCNISVTMQSINFIEMNFKNHEFEYVHIIKELKNFYTNKEALHSLCEKIKNCDGIIWAFPVYHLLVPSHYKEFIELIFENNCASYFKDKCTCIFSTSIHYYDITAHEYMKGILNDLNMNLIDSLSHDMDDLLKEDKRKNLLLFFENFLYSIKNNIHPTPSYLPLNKKEYVFSSNNIENKLVTNKNIIILTDLKDDDISLKNMIHHYINCFDTSSTFIKVINLREIDFNYCIGCCNCAKENKCIFDNKDSYRKTLDYILKNADILIYAGKIIDRYLSSLFKKYFDRTFCYNHVPIFKDKQIGFILSNDLTCNLNLKLILQLYAQQGANLIGFTSDQTCDTELIKNGLESLAKLSARYCENNYFRPKNFLGIAGEKLFRDAIFGELGAIFIKDYDYYKKHSIFDYLTFKEKIKYAFRRFFFKKDKVRAEIDKNMINLMIAPHKKICSKLKNETIQGE